MAAKFHIVAGERLSSADCEKLAQLHCESLPESVPAYLGKSYAARFYEAVATSELEIVVVGRDPAGAIVGAAVVTKCPGNMGARLLSLTYARMISSIVSILFFGPGRRRKGLASAMLSPSLPDSESSMLLLYLFVKAENRESGIGQAILDELCRLTADAGCENLCVLTEDHSENAAIAFYSRRGFVHRNRVRRKNGDFVVLERKLVNGSREPEILSGLEG